MNLINAVVITTANLCSTRVSTVVLVTVFNCHDSLLLLQSFEEAKLIPMADVSMTRAGWSQYGHKHRYSHGPSTASPTGNIRSTTAMALVQ